jgi:putative transcriptional regulator
LGNPSFDPIHQARCSGILVLALLAFCPAFEARAQETLEPGSFLVASRELRDPNFRETVVLIVEHNRRGGALGLIVNRPSEVTLSQLLPELEAARGEDHVYRGGPVDPMQVTLLMRSSEPESDGAHPAQHVFEDVYFSSSRGLLQWLATDPEPTERFRVFAGHSGWAPGQLEMEIEAGGWHVLKGDAAAIFEEPSDMIWPRLILKGTAEWARLGTVDIRPVAAR